MASHAGRNRPLGPSAPAALLVAEDVTDERSGVPRSAEFEFERGEGPSLVVGRTGLSASQDSDAEAAARTAKQVQEAPGARAGTTGHVGRALRLRLVTLDSACMALSWIVLGGALSRTSTTLGRLLPGMTATAATLLMMRWSGLYRSRMCARGTDELGRVALASLSGLAIFLLVQWQLAALGQQALLCAAVGTVVTASARRQFGRWLRTARAQGRFVRGVVLIGANDDAAGLRTMLLSEPELGYVVKGVIGECADAAAWRDLPSSSSLDDLPAIAATTGASGVLIVPYALSSGDTDRAISVATCSNLHVQMWPALHGVGSRRLRIVPVSGEAFFYVEPGFKSSWQLIVKRAIDVVGAAAGLALTAPVLALAAALVKLDSPGPAFHRGVRVGMNGNPFVTYKLRSMRSVGNLESSALTSINERTDGPLFKASQDPRVTRVGHILRSTSIDEIPQLWNVLCGTMSLVGPRPALPGEVAHFDKDLLRRHCVRPGITGLWQIEARRNPSFRAYRRLDLSYVDNWSLGLDLSILAATVPSVLSQAIRELRRARHA